MSTFQSKFECQLFNGYANIHRSSDSESGVPGASEDIGFVESTGLNPVAFQIQVFVLLVDQPCLLPRR